MHGKLLLVLTSLLLVTACGNNETEQGINDNNIQPINYETPKEQTDRLSNQDKSIGELGGYPQSDQEYVNEGDRNLSAKNEDRYTNERTLQISEYLAERKEIVQAQVAETDDRIIVGVMTANNEHFPGLDEIVVKEVEQVVPDKEIVVYTQDIWWDRMRDLNSNPKNLNEDIERDFEDFFNND